MPVALIEPPPYSTDEALTNSVGTSGRGPWNMHNPSIDATNSQLHMRGISGSLTLHHTRTATKSCIAGRRATKRACHIAELAGYAATNGIANVEAVNVVRKIENLRKRGLTGQGGRHITP
mgnify:CR=1 FL=1